MKTHFLEADLYEPVKQFLVGLGYQVNGEVKGCDLTAVKDEELIIVELKKSFTLALLYQAMDRQSMTDQVFVAVPRPAGKPAATLRNMKNIVKKLKLGLIIVAIDSPLRHVEVLVFPDSKKPRETARRRALLREIAGRRTDGNRGGGSRVKLLTAYREQALKIACILEKKGVLSARELVRDHGCERNAYSVLSRNPYGWFIKVARGQYTLTEKGRRELEEDGFREIVTYYRENN